MPVLPVYEDEILNIKFIFFIYIFTNIPLCSKKVNMDILRCNNNVFKELKYNKFCAVCGNKSWSLKLFYLSGMALNTVDWK